VPLERIEIGDEEIKPFSARICYRPAGVDLGRKTTTKADHG